ncbi:MAG: pilus assembly protein [bacterium]
MKRILYILIGLALLSFLPTGAHAEEHNFGAGSLIIPMDSVYQPEDDGGTLEAYGLVYTLLDHTDPTSDEHDITLYWVLDHEKASIDATDLLIEDLTLEEGEVVASLYDHAGGSSTFTFKEGDDFQRISYIGAPFIVDEFDADKAQSIINQSGWDAVNVHVVEVPFAAMVHRKMCGAPPRIALMNSEEDDSKGNAAILEAYLRLAGICTDVYDIVSPNDIRDGVLRTSKYEFLWAPHWDGYKKYDLDGDGDGISDVEEIVRQIRLFLEKGKGLLAECASIETFEHSTNGQFLTTEGLGHNGGTNDADDILYYDWTSPNSQIGDFKYKPEGGHLHNWRPYQISDPYDFDTPPSTASAYNDTVTRYTIDTTGWDYYVGGYTDGDSTKGYVVYLGGHRYAECKGEIEVNPTPEVHALDLEFKNETKNPDTTITLLVEYDGSASVEVVFKTGDLTPVVGDPLEIDLTTASVSKKKLLGVTLRNKRESAITIDHITVSWDRDLNKIIKITDTKTDVRIWDEEEESGTRLDVIDFKIDPGGEGVSAACTNNSDCSWKNIAGVKYILNTLFNIKYQIPDRNYVRSAPVVIHPYLYQGKFEYPSYEGHFCRYQVTDSSSNADWDTAERLKEAKNQNSDADARQVFTAMQDGNGTWCIIDFDSGSIDNLRSALNLTPSDGDDDDEIIVINRLRGKDWDASNDIWVEQSNRLGGIMHSAPVIVEDNTRNSRMPSRKEMAYVGDVDGILHAINTSTGEEKWAFIPPNLLGKLKNDRTDPLAVQDFAAVDGSPAAKDVFYDHDGDGDSEWRTILVCTEGFGGNYLFALDVTDPNNWSYLWETTDPYARGGGMGHAYRCAINRVKAPVLNEKEEVIGYEGKYMIFVATGFADIVSNHGGINVFAFDLKTGTKVWRFSQEYANSVNDIPGAVTLFDHDGDSFIDNVYVGDMNGRIWELNALDGSNPNGTEEIGCKEYEIPLYNVGVANPISVSPAIIRNCLNHVVLIFGTGGADWASDERAYALYAVDVSDKLDNKTYAAGAASPLWQIDLAIGEKVWSAPTVAAGRVFFATSFGTMESSDLRVDLMVRRGNLYCVDLIHGSELWTLTDIGKTRGSIFVDRKHVYISTIDNQIIQVGNEDFSKGNVSNVNLKAWKQL